MAPMGSFIRSFIRTDDKKEYKQDTMKLNLENLEEKFETLLSSDPYKKFISDYLKCKNFYLIGNGGLWSTANHAADDCNRLLSKGGVDKMFYSMDSQCLITSVSNDYGFNNMFVRWLELYKKRNTKASETMVIGLSCSGTSKNVISSLHWAKEKGYKTCLISGQKSSVLPEDVLELCFNTEYFHTTEIISLMFFYQLIIEGGASCPTIKEEIIRKGAAQGLTRPTDE
jgi:phosphoheptose isomerase